jgi:hypothetical protein
MRSLCSALGYLPSAPLAGRRYSPAATAAVTSALSELGLPYVFGTSGPAAYDCSGLRLGPTAGTP